MFCFFKGANIVLNIYIYLILNSIFVEPKQENK